MDLAAVVTEAERRIRPYIRETPVEPSPVLGQGVFLKLENIQHTGSFKVRGAMNKLLALTPAQQARGVVTASSGNHGAAVAYGLQLLGIKGIVFVPQHASPTKVSMIRRYGADIRHHGDDCLITELFARSYAEQHEMTYISPYNDIDIVGGQGTIAVELARQLPQIDTVFVAVGGGGLVSGIAGYLKAHNPAVRIVGCLPENEPTMAASVAARRIVEIEPQPTLSDATAGGLEPGSITFDLCRQLVDDFVLVTEDEIKAALRLCLDDHHMLVEGAAGVAVAAYRKSPAHLQGANAVIILCGANISLETLKTILTSPHA
jgi:threonine dehydratase